MELLFLAILVVIMAVALGSGYPVAFALPGAAILSIGLAALCGWLFADNPDAYFHSGGPSQWLSAGVTNLRGVYWDVDRDTLIAIPLFIFMGIMLQRSKIAEDLLVTMAQLFGPIPGGLGISVVFVGALLAATTGIVGATVVAMGLISLPAMLRNNYSKPLATGTIAASGTLGQIIPPSIVLIILADQLASATDQASTARKALHKASTGELSMPSQFDVSSTSAGEMFLGAFLPGLVLVGLYMAYILIFALLRPSAAPAVSYEGKFDMAFWGRVCLILIPPLALIFLVLGSIIMGIATVNQAGAIGAAGALIMAGYRLTEGQARTYWPALLAIAALILAGFAIANYPMNVKAVWAEGDGFGIALGVVATIMLLLALLWSGWRAYRIDDTLQGVMIETAKTTSLVFIILLGAAMLTAAFRAFGGEELVKGFLEGLPGGFWTKFIIVMAVIFVLGFFLDFIEIAVVVVPIVAPILLADPSANITAVWLGVMIGLNIQTSFLTPPFGFALFYLRGVAPAVVKTIQMYKGVIAFIGLQIAALVIVGLYPPLVNYLPNRVSFLSETAPPPRNPRIQYCVEDYIHGRFAAGAPQLTSALGQVEALDLAALPADMRNDIAGSVDNARKAVELLLQAKVAEGEVDAASDDYRAVHSVVRALQRDARIIDERIDRIKTRISRLRGDENAALRDELTAEIAQLEAERDELLSQIPADWDATQAAFAELTKAEETIRRNFRRASDDSYNAALEASQTLQATEAFLALESRFEAVRQAIVTQEADAAMDVIQDLERAFDAVAGAGDVKSALSKSRRALRGRNPDPQEANTELDKAIVAFGEQAEWRKAAQGAATQGLADYEVALRETVGLRQQSGMTREQALFVASCQSDHRDISLNF
ncbi:MAG: TRAP transporter large permease subunit [Ahrensia sp.]|nr:TRAP transporter large permease subunit [Ahrensia sp.]